VLLFLWHGRGDLERLSKLPPAQDMDCLHPGHDYRYTPQGEVHLKLAGACFEEDEELWVIAKHETTELPDTVPEPSVCAECGHPVYPRTGFCSHCGAMTPFGEQMLANPPDSMESAT